MMTWESHVFIKKYLKNRSSSLYIQLFICMNNNEFKLVYLCIQEKNYNKVNKRINNPHGT